VARPGRNIAGMRVSRAGPPPRTDALLKELL